MGQKQAGKFKVGQKVWLEHTREEAVITKIDKSGVLYVKAGAHVIPVFMSQVSKRLPVSAEATKDKDIKDGKEGKEITKVVESKIDKTKIVKPRVALLFVPGRLKDGEIVNYELGLLNETSEPFHARIELLKNDIETINDLVAAYDFKTLKKFEAEKLNDLVSVRIRITPVDELLDVFESEQKIKPSSFIRKIGLVESLGTEAYVYELLDRFAEAPVREDIFKDTNKKIAVPEVDASTDNWKLDHLRQLILDKPVPKEKAPVKPEKEVDLHVEAFLENTEGLSATDILLLQLERFRKSLDRAILSGQKVLTVVHGVGKGKLRKEIEKILDDNEHVIDYRDAGYPKYGYGATEVHLK